jgi:hypothetical protein
MALYPLTGPQDFGLTFTLGYDRNEELHVSEPAK